jgi:hypothetical protein
LDVGYGEGSSSHALTMSNESPSTSSNLDESE